MLVSCFRCDGKKSNDFTVIIIIIIIIIIIVVVVIIIIILGISFMQGIYTYIPETNHVPMEHCVAAILM
jgi:flagellar basal body-associated protein FliL